MIIDALSQGAEIDIFGQWDGTKLPKTAILAVDFFTLCYYTGQPVGLDRCYIWFRYEKCTVRLFKNGKQHVEGVSGAFEM